MNYNDQFIYRDGALYHKHYKNPAAQEGQRAGRLVQHRVVNGKYEHRVIWEMHNGPIPKGMTIDHINRDPLDNRIENLRMVSMAVNNTNKMGKGYTQTASGKYRARMQHKGKQIMLGLYDTPEEARAAYLAEKRKYA